MAGVSVTITVEDAEVQAMLTRIAGFGAAPLRETLVDIGRTLKGATEDRARAEVTPDGVPWLDLSEDYAAWKTRKRPGAPTLKFDLHMLGDQFTYQVGEGFVDIGTNAPYGAIHQLGGTDDMAPGPAAIPARPWLGVSADDRVELGEILAEHLQAAIEGR